MSSPPEQEAVTLWRARAGCVWRLPAHEREAGRKRQQGWLSEDFVPLARLEAAEARARTAEEALERIAHLRVTSGLAPEIARSALATIRGDQG